MNAVLADSSRPLRLARLIAAKVKPTSPRVGGAIPLFSASLVPPVIPIQTSSAIFKSRTTGFPPIKHPKLAI